MDKEGLRIAYIEAAKSPDPSTQMGAVLVRKDLTDQILGVGFNDFPPGIKQVPERWEDRELKYEYVCHAEVSAILAAQDFGMHGCTEFVTLPACTNCAKYMILAGVKCVVGHQQYAAFMSKHNPSWNESRHLGLDMLDEAGVLVRWLDGPVPDAPKIRIGGLVFDPSSEQ